MTSIILSYFHSKLGPIIYYKPKALEINEKVDKRILSSFEADMNGGYIILCFPKENIRIFNFYFEKKALGTRGGYDMFVLSVIFKNEFISSKGEIELLKIVNKFIKDFNFNDHEIYLKKLEVDLNEMFKM